MKLLEDFFSWFLIVYVASIPIIWLWVFYHKVKCRKVDSCVNRKCKFWQWCSHNKEERKKDELEYRRQWLMRRYGLSENDLE